MKMIKTLANNQTVVIIDETSYYFSYDKLIATYKNDKLSFTSLWDYSRTTSKYLRIFINDYINFNEDVSTKAKIQKLIDNGTIKIEEQ